MAGPYVVRGATARGSVTYRCPDPAWALRKLRDFEAAGYAEIRAVGPGGEPVTAADLEALAAGQPRPAAAPAGG